MMCGSEHGTLRESCIQARCAAHVRHSPGEYFRAISGAFVVVVGAGLAPASAVLAMTDAEITSTHATICLVPAILRTCPPGGGYATPTNEASTE